VGLHGAVEHGALGLAATKGRGARGGAGGGNGHEQ